jgi:hypothetical protein
MSPAPASFLITTACINKNMSALVPSARPQTWRDADHPAFIQIHRVFLLHGSHRDCSHRDCHTCLRDWQSRKPPLCKQSGPGIGDPYRPAKPVEPAGTKVSFQTGD